MQTYDVNSKVKVLKKGGLSAWNRSKHFVYLTCQNIQKQRLLRLQNDFLCSLRNYGETFMECDNIYVSLGLTCMNVLIPNKYKVVEELYQ